MRKWQNLAPPDDPNSWYDVDGFWPTNRGSYETADFLASTSYTGTGTDYPMYAWSAKTVSTATGDPHYVVDHGGVENTGFIWSVSGATLTNVTGTVVWSSLRRVQFAQYGSVTIGVLGSPRVSQSAGGTCYTTGPSVAFAALAGAPSGDSICVQSNAVVILNTGTANDGWAASDVGDYTNWTTGESASGRIYDPPGPIMAGVAYSDHVVVFKTDSIHRLRYVGGVVKWLTEKVWSGAGCGATNRACAGATGILYAGVSAADTGSPTVPYYWFDGANPPIMVNPFTEINATGPIVYNELKNIFSVWNTTTGAVYYFDPVTRMWGKSASPFNTTTSPVPVPVEGTNYSLAQNTTRSWGKSATDTLKYFATGNNTGASYLQSTMQGRSDRKTTFTRVTPQLRRRVDQGSGVAALSALFYREREDTAATTTLAIAESTQRKRFDITGAGSTDNFARFKITYTNFDIEADDILVGATDAGTD